MAASPGRASPPPFAPANGRHGRVIAKVKLETKIRRRGEVYSGGGVAGSVSTAGSVQPRAQWGCT
ncbi:hypothetical protein N181_09590 [Sinorhizobium fredii USDA 205]|nr:hypothetical protein N181_09590 [Sinorhizobium fredii USDA 205]GEC30557.1 hypothetical protein EFR01_07280 [Sinorhizobium fredii]GLS09754.1 hypothetical protein GCM10007864_33850 [Sinorhizobium fredii]